MKAQPCLMLVGALLAGALGGCAGAGVQPVPDAIAPGADHALHSTLAATGVQIYECRAGAAAETRPQWTLVAPEAELFDAAGRSAGRHGAGPHWEADDGSRVIGTLQARVDAPSAGDIPWLLLAAQPADTAGRFSTISRIQRINTAGGAAPPPATCNERVLGLRARAAYTADYRLYTRR